MLLESALMMRAMLWVAVKVDGGVDVSSAVVCMFLLMRAMVAFCAFEFAVFGCGLCFECGLLEFRLLQFGFEVSWFYVWRGCSLHSGCSVAKLSAMLHAREYPYPSRYSNHCVKELSGRYSHHLKHAGILILNYKNRK